MTPAPLKLRPDNFTPPARTPWGGRRLLDRYKAGLGLETAGVVGESWEVSVEPSFPSRTAEGELLAEVIARAPADWLGAELARRDGQTTLLVKLLDAADDLSVQVHPRDDDPALGAGDSGKPEAWIVLDADPGAGLHLGFRPGIGERDVRACIDEGGALERLMHFVEAAPGDAFTIEAGMPHAIGRGITLLEPQRVVPNKRGVTYRFWDFGRRYDEHGRIDPAGRPRELHVERSLAVTAWDRGAESCRARASALGLGRELVIDWPHFLVERWSGTWRSSLPSYGTMLAVTCAGGHLRLRGKTGELALRSGESGVVPAVAGALALECDDVLAFATYARLG